MRRLRELDSQRFRELYWDTETLDSVRYDYLSDTFRYFVITNTTTNNTFRITSMETSTSGSIRAKVRAAMRKTYPILLASLLTLIRFAQRILQAQINSTLRLCLLLKSWQDSTQERLSSIQGRVPTSTSQSIQSAWTTAIERAFLDALERSRTR